MWVWVDPRYRRDTSLPGLPKDGPCFMPLCRLTSATFSCGHNWMLRGWSPEGKVVGWEQGSTHICAALKQSTATQVSLYKGGCWRGDDFSRCLVSALWLFLCCEKLSAFLLIPIKSIMKVAAFKAQKWDHSRNASWQRLRPREGFLQSVSRGPQEFPPTPPTPHTLPRGQG